MTINERNLMLKKRNIKKYEFGGHFKSQNVSYWAKSHMFAYKNILFVLFAPGAVPRSSALCLFFISWGFDLAVTIILVPELWLSW